MSTLSFISPPAQPCRPQTIPSYSKSPKLSFRLAAAIYNPFIAMGNIEELADIINITYYQYDANSKLRTLLAPKSLNTTWPTPTLTSTLKLLFTSYLKCLLFLTNALNRHFNHISYGNMSLSFPKENMYRKHGGI